VHPDSGWPVLVIELKWNKSAEGAIDQTMEKKYPEVLKNCSSELLLVGVNYNKDGKKHSCRIVRYRWERKQYILGSS